MCSALRGESLGHALGRKYLGEEKYGERGRRGRSQRMREIVEKKHRKKSQIRRVSPRKKGWDCCRRSTKREHTQQS